MDNKFSENNKYKNIEDFKIGYNDSILCKQYLKKKYGIYIKLKAVIVIQIKKKDKNNVITIKNFK